MQLTSVGHAIVQSLPTRNTRRGAHKQPLRHASTGRAVQKPRSAAAPAAVTVASSASVMGAHAPRAYGEPAMESKLTPMAHQACSRLPCVMCLHLAVAMLTCAAYTPVRFTSVGHAIAQSLLTQNQLKGAHRQPLRHASSRCAIQAAKQRVRICRSGTCQRSKCHSRRRVMRSWRASNGAKSHTDAARGLQQIAVRHVPAPSGFNADKCSRHTCALDKCCACNCAKLAVPESARRRAQPATETREQPARFTGCQAARPYLSRWHLPVAQVSFAQMRQTLVVSQRIEHQQHCWALHCWRHDQRHNAV